MAEFIVIVLLVICAAVVGVMLFVLLMTALAVSAILGVTGIVMSPLILPIGMIAAYQNEKRRAKEKKHANGPLT